MRYNVISLLFGVTLDLEIICIDIITVKLTSVIYVSLNTVTIMFDTYNVIVQDALFKTKTNVSILDY